MKPLWIAKEKGAALKNLRKRARFSQQTFGELLRGTGFTRHSISRWEQGQNWPEALELVFEQVFAAPRGFFARIGAGVSYEEALSALPQERAPAQGPESPLTLPLTGSASAPIREEDAQLMYGRPLARPDLVQAHKFQQLLEYLAALRTGLTVVTLAAALNFPLGIVTEWADGRRSIPAIACELMAHRWDLRESFWTAPAEASWLNYVGRRQVQTDAPHRHDGGVPQVRYIVEEEAGLVPPLRVSVSAAEELRALIQEALSVLNQIATVLREEEQEEGQEKRERAQEGRKDDELTTGRVPLNKKRRPTLDPDGV